LLLVSRPGKGWPRSRGDSLAELGITEEEFEEYASRKPRRPAADSEDMGVSSLAMGMDVDPAAAAAKQQPPGSRPRASECPCDLCLP
jgi:hypothetical protein